MTLDLPLEKPWHPASHKWSFEPGANSIPVRLASAGIAESCVLTLGELKSGKAKLLVAKEALLGVCNGALVGLTAGIGMYVYATMQQNPAALMLAVCVVLTMTASCLLSGISGTLVPLALKRRGADPATASSNFLTTATDVASMGTFLGLATLLVR